MTYESLGLCEDCKYMRRLRPTTIDGSVEGELIAYCDKIKHETKGYVRCRLFRARRDAGGPLR